MQEEKASDTALIRRCLEGDETAWRWLIEQHRERLFRVALSLLGNPSEAEEAAQETFVQIFRHLERFRGGSSLYTWACRICINLCLRRKERAGRSQKREFSLNDVEIPDRIEALIEAETPEDELVRKELAGYIRQEMRTLPEDYQAVLVLREMDGLSYEKIAESLGISMGTVKSRVHRGRLLLKERLKEFIHGGKDAS